MQLRPKRQRKLTHSSAGRQFMRRHFWHSIRVMQRAAFARNDEPHPSVLNHKRAQFDKDRY